MKKILILATFLIGFGANLKAQNTAALQRLALKYTPEQIQDMQSHDQGKYQSLIWWVTTSYQVVENGLKRYPTDAEILAIDIFAHDEFRSVEEEVNVKLPDLGIALALKSGNQCWQELKTVLEPAAWTAMHDRFMRNMEFKKTGQTAKSAN